MSRSFRLSHVAAIATLAAAGVSSHAATVSVTVAGTSNPYLAGMPDGSTTGSDQAPAQSPVQVPGSLAGGALTFTNAAGGVSRAPGCVGACNPIDGNEFWDHSYGAVHGISDMRAPIESLVGVFLDASQPDSSAAPSALDFQTLGLDFLNLAPELKQVFFIGDGLTSANVVQQFAVPTGATRLYLAVWDGYGWYNNSGAITIDVNGVQLDAGTVPEPSTAALLALGVGAILALRRRTRLQDCLLQAAH